jgi:hypothetical protein
MHLEPEQSGPQSESLVQVGGNPPVHSQVPDTQPQPQPQSALLLHVVATGTQVVPSLLHCSFAAQGTALPQTGAQLVIGLVAHVSTLPAMQRLAPSVLHVTSQVGAGRQQPTPAPDPHVVGSPQVPLAQASGTMATQVPPACAQAVVVLGRQQPTPTPDPHVVGSPQVPSAHASGVTPTQVPPAAVQALVGLWPPPPEEVLELVPPPPPSPWAMVAGLQASSTRDEANASVAREASRSMVIVSSLARACEDALAIFEESTGGYFICSRSLRTRSS